MRWDVTTSTAYGSPTTKMELSIRTQQPSHMMNPLTSIYQATKNSDFQIFCRGKTYPVHKAILRARSQFFDGAFRNPFKEMHSNRIDLSEDDPEAVEHMVTYFYNLEYLPTPRTVVPQPSEDGDATVSSAPSLCSSPTSPLSPTFPSTPSETATTVPRTRKVDFSSIEDPLLAIAADNMPKKARSPRLSKFGVTSPLVGADEPPHILAVKQSPEFVPPTIDTTMRLREEALSSPAYFPTFDEEAVPEQETNFMFPNLVTHAKVYAIAEQYGIRNLKALAKKKYAAQVSAHRASEDFAASLPEVYDGTVDSDRGLRDVVIATFRRYPELAQRRNVGDVVKETPGLAWELFRVAWGLPV